MWISKTGRSTRILINWKAVSQKMVDAFFLEILKEQPEKRLGYGFSQGENWRKRLSFHRAVEMKQPHAMTEPTGKVFPRTDEVKRVNLKMETPLMGVPSIW